MENAAGGAIAPHSAMAGHGRALEQAPRLPWTTTFPGSNWSTCTSGNSCIASIAFNGAAQDTNSAPFYDYNTDILYVGDNNGKLHKFTGVFNGTATEFTTGWPITVNLGAILTGPVYDGVSGKHLCWR